MSLCKRQTDPLKFLNEVIVCWLIPKANFGIPYEVTYLRTPSIYWALKTYCIVNTDNSKRSVCLVCRACPWNVGLFLTNWSKLLYIARRLIRQNKIKQWNYYYYLRNKCRNLKFLKMPASSYATRISIGSLAFMKGIGSKLSTTEFL